jgi:hypothetical protein
MQKMNESEKNIENDSLEDVVVPDAYTQTWNPYQTIVRDPVYSSLPISPTSPAFFYPRLPNGFDKR